MEAIPFDDATFDIVTCAWALETSANPARAIAKLQRVLRRGGLLCLAFCADQPANGLVQKAIRLTLKLRGAGRILGLREVMAAVVATDTARVLSVPVTGSLAMLIERCEKGNSNDR